MVYLGTVRGGVIVLAPGETLPEGITVIVQPQEPVSQPSDSPFELRNGVPFFRANESSVPVTVELVNRLRDEFP